MTEIFSSNSILWNLDVIPGRGNFRHSFVDPGTSAPGVHRPTLPGAQGGVPTGPRQTSSVGMVGLIIGLPTLFFFWVPILGWIGMGVGMGLSIAGFVTGRQKGEPVVFAIAGIVVNGISLAIHTVVYVLIILFWKIVTGVLSEILPFLKFFPFF